MSVTDKCTWCDADVPVMDLREVPSINHRVEQDRLCRFCYHTGYHLALGGTKLSGLAMLINRNCNLLWEKLNDTRQEATGRNEDGTR